MEKEPEISPTTTIIAGKSEKYTINDEDYLLIIAIRELTATIEKMRRDLNG